MALAVVLMLTGLFAAVATGLSLLVRLETMQAGADETTRRNFYAAEAGINRGMGSVRNIFLDFNVPSGDDFSSRSLTMGSQTVSYRLAEVPGNPRTVTLPPGDAFAGLNSLQYRYSMLSDALGGGGRREARVGSSFEVNNVPLFQFLAFYDPNLEITPAADMNLHGRIHTNGSLWLNIGSGQTLRIEDSPPNQRIVQVSAVGEIRRGRSDSATCSGTVVVDKREDVVAPLGNLDPLTMACSGGTRALTPAEVGAWGGSIITGIGSINVPAPDILDRSADALYWSRADLRIVLNANAGRTDQLNATGPVLKALEVRNVDGSVDATLTNRLRTYLINNPGRLFYNDVPLNTGLCTQGCDPSSTLLSCGAKADNRLCYAPTFGTLLEPCGVYRRADEAAPDANWTENAGAMRCKYDYRRGGFYNNREHRWILMLDLDLGALLAWNRNPANAANRLFDPDDTSDGGIVLYLSVDGPASGSANSGYGVRIFDSPDLGFPAAADPTGITVVSDQAIYVQGNFNSAGSKAPAAFLADSVNVLSQGWEAFGDGLIANKNDKVSGMTLNPRRHNAGATTINAAFLAGTDDPTVAYTGGLQNYPRFHESWTGVNFVYRGSFVTLGPPRKVTGDWFMNGDSYNMYNPPNRNWDYDTDFNDAAKLPPLTPRLIWVQQTLFSQDFR